MRKLTHVIETKMSHQVVDFENLMDTSFTDANASGRSSMRPRWERKKQQSLLETENRRPNGASTGDRFIPNRGAMNMDLNKHLMRSTSSDMMETEAINTSYDGKHMTVSESKKDVYESNLSSALFGVDDIKGNRIMSYQEKAPVPKGDTINNLNILYSASVPTGKKTKGNAKLVNRQIPGAPSRILDAPDLLDDYYLNLVSWSDTNILAVALGQTVYLWDASSGDIQELCTFEDGPNAHISSVSWIQQGGSHLAVGTSNGETQLWDVHECKQLRSMDGHSDRVGSLAWNRHILSSGGRDTAIVNHDVRVARHNVASMIGHTQEICGLSWSPDGETLASGGNDNLLCLWDASLMSGSSVPPKFRLTDHQAAVKALSWSPHERNLLASGGGTADRTIKFWNSQSGSLLNSIDTGSQVCALQWNPHEKEILSSHGFARNQLSLWKYPSMAKIKDLEGHTARVLHMAISPDGGTVLSAAADETLRFWDIFAPPTTGKVSKKGAFLGASTKARWTSQIR